MKFRIPFRVSTVAVPLVCLLIAAPHSLAAESTPAAREAAALPSLAPLVDAVKEAVVNVEVQARVSGPRFSMGEDFGDDFFDRFFGRGGRGNRRGSEQLRQ